MAVKNQDSPKINISTVVLGLVGSLITALLVLIFTNLLNMNNTVGKIDSRQVYIEKDISNLAATLTLMQKDIKDDFKTVNDKFDKIRK